MSGPCSAPTAVGGWATLVWPPRQTFDSDSAAGPPAAPDAPRDPERIGGYRLVRLVGRGGMGSVYEAEDLESGRRVALKLLAGDSVASPEAVERFRREGRLASTIAHPRCVFVLAADEEEGRPYIVMELMPGETLQSLVERSGPLPPREATGKILDVIEGLTEAHQVGIIHRDVKPSNCFLEADGRVKIGDFGLSKSLGGDSELDPDRGLPRDPALCLSRADQVRPDRRPDRRVLDGGDALLLAHRPAAVPGVRRGGDAGADRLGAGAVDARLQAGCPGRARRGGPARAGT